MAGKSKKGAQKLKLVHKDEEGKITYTYYTSKNFKTKTEKFKFMKYHPVLRKHVLFEEAKIK